MASFGFRTGTFPGWAAEKVAEELAQLGYDCIEFCLEPPDVRPALLNEARCRELRRRFDELGIALASVSYHGDVETPAERRANQERTIRVAQWIGAEVVVLNGERTVDRERQWPEHVRRFQALCRLADEAGVLLAVEPEPQLVIASTQDMVEMLAAVGSPRLRVNLDVGHARLTDGDIAASIRRLGPAIVHLHLEDIRGDVHRHLPFGEGDIDFSAVRGALAEIGYAGPYVADLFGQAAAPRDVAAQALEGLRRLFG